MQSQRLFSNNMVVTTTDPDHPSFLDQAVTGDREALSRFFSSHSFNSTIDVGRAIIYHLSECDLSQCDAFTLWYAARIYMRMAYRQTRPRFVDRLVHAADNLHFGAMAALFMLISRLPLGVEKQKLVLWKEGITHAVNENNLLAKFALAMFYHYLDTQHAKQDAEKLAYNLLVSLTLTNEHMSLVSYYVAHLYENSPLFHNMLANDRAYNAAKWYQDAAQFGNPEAYNDVIYYYRIGYLGPTNSDSLQGKAREVVKSHIQAAKRAGNTRVLRLEAFMLLTEGLNNDANNAINALLASSAIEQCVSEKYHAYELLAMMHLYERIHDSQTHAFHENEATKWFKLAESHHSNHPESLISMACLYLDERIKIDLSLEEREQKALDLLRNWPMFQGDNVYRILINILDNPEGVYYDALTLAERRSIITKCLQKPVALKNDLSDQSDASSRHGGSALFTPSYAVRTGRQKANTSCSIWGGGMLMKSFMGE